MWVEKNLQNIKIKFKCIQCIRIHSFFYMVNKFKYICVVSFVEGASSAKKQRIEKDFYFKKTKNGLGFSDEINLEKSLDSHPRHLKDRKKTQFTMDIFIF